MSEQEKIYIEALIADFSRISAAYDSLLTKVSISATLSSFLMFETYEIFANSNTMVLCIIAVILYVIALLISLFLLFSNTLKAPYLEKIGRDNGNQYFVDMMDTYVECIRIVSEKLTERHKLFNLVIVCLVLGIVTNIVSFGVRW